MQLSATPECCRFYNNVSSIPSRTITLASSARRRASTLAHHPTTPFIIISIAFTLFFTFRNRSEATSNTEIRTTLFVLVHLSFLFGLLSALSAAFPSVPVVETPQQRDQPAFIEESETPSTHCLFLFRRSVCGYFPESICIFIGLSCFVALVWLFLKDVHVISDIAAAAASTAALRRLRTTSRSVP
ncbi:hypothetical protein BGW80DRAFT_687927 [Lactifluus volemus]|nr:hypothetical protein BGW80DRAFT_687927 [Lactifluus volemus]